MPPSIKPVKYIQSVIKAMIIEYLSAQLFNLVIYRFMKFNRFV
jgi:hypothetical protein